MNYYSEIKEELINNEINKKVKSSLINNTELNTYYYVGKILYNAGNHYGDGIIKKYSEKLIKEVDKKFNTTTLKRIRQFYIMISNGALLGHQLTWSHYRELIPLKDIDKINYYINICEKNIISRDELKRRIKLNEYERLDEQSRNKILKNNKLSLEDSIPNPIILKAI